jgi:predicted phosphodiesterase
MIAILSDIHGNLEALEAVLTDIQQKNIEAIYCLGDLIGYGPDPLPCIELAMHWPVVLQGNADKAALIDEVQPGFWGSRHANQTFARFREQLELHPQRDKLRQFLTQRPMQYSSHDAHFVHANLHFPAEYDFLFPEDIYVPSKLNSLAELFDRICFCGHSHIPGIFSCNRSQEWVYFAPEENDHFYVVHGKKIICNVGSVGQPRDGNPDACYVLWENDFISFRRIPYDREKTIAKIIAAGDNHMDGDRYRYGR